MMFLPLQLSVRANPQHSKVFQSTRRILRRSLEPTMKMRPFLVQLALAASVAWAATVCTEAPGLPADGKSIAQADAGNPAPSLPEDHEFDFGSRIAIARLSPVQIDNLATLARVWGFLKYHHPAVTSGKLHWDYELFRILPAILAAPDPANANAALSAWIDKTDGLGPVQACNPCASLPAADYDLKPPIGWIRDTAALGTELSRKLQRINENRSGNQFFVSIARNDNPSFDHEPRYAAVQFPDSGYQLLALFRWWNIVQYWTPGRDVAAQDWPGVLRTYIPKLALARDKNEYQLVLFELIATLNDTHANLWSSLAVRPPAGP